MSNPSQCFQVPAFIALKERTASHRPALFTSGSLGNVIDQSASGRFYLHCLATRITKACGRDKALINFSAGGRRPRRPRVLYETIQGNNGGRSFGGSVLTRCWSTRLLCSTSGRCCSQHNYTRSSCYIIKEKSTENHHLSLRDFVLFLFNIFANETQEHRT